MIKRLIFLVLLAVLVVAGINFYLEKDDLSKCGESPDGNSNCQTVDAIVAISGGDTAARTVEAIKLYKAGWSNKLIFSGAAEDKTGPSNAHEMKQIAISAGVPTEAIMIDEFAETTRENAENTQIILDGLNAEKIILVTSGYHQKRAELEFKQYTKNISIISHPTKTDKDWSFFWWMTTRGWWLAGTEVVKILIFKVVGA